jgi:hypothetical protein
LLPNIWRIVDVFTAKLAAFFTAKYGVNHDMLLAKIGSEGCFFPWMNAAFRHISTPHVGDFDQG